MQDFTLPRHDGNCRYLSEPNSCPIAHGTLGDPMLTRASALPLEARIVLTTRLPGRGLERPAARLRASSM